MNRPNFDHLQFLHTASDQKLDGGKAQERGYELSIFGYTCSLYGQFQHMNPVQLHGMVSVASVTSTVVESADHSLSKSTGSSA